MNTTTTNMVRTQSPVMAWYFATFRGMKVFTTYCQPTICVFGYILYQHSWVMVQHDHPSAVLNIF